jgi:hypothetical protein
MNRPLWLDVISMCVLFAPAIVLAVISGEWLRRWQSWPDWSSYPIVFGLFLLCFWLQILGMVCWQGRRKRDKPGTMLRRKEFADRLEGLLLVPLNAPSDVERWTDARYELESWIASHADELPDVPSFLMFYFHDPDIRVEEPEYKATQELAIRNFIHKLRQAAQPDDQPHNASQHLDSRMPGD